jgi:hypothetical protein
LETTLMADRDFTLAARDILAPRAKMPARDTRPIRAAARRHGKANVLEHR